MVKDSVKIALIPSFEPDQKLIEIVSELNKNDYKVIVVNDGSEEKYDKIFNKCKCKVISYDNNKGKGYALKEGLKFIKNNYENAYIVTMDSDGQHTVSDANKLIEYLKHNKSTLVLGSRKRSKKTPLKSFLGNMITCFTFDLITHNKIYDTQTGLRAFSSGLVDYMLSVEGERYEYEMNVLLHLGQQNINTEEVQIRMVYLDNNSSSHFNPVKDSFKIYKEILRFSASSLLSFVIDYSLFCTLMALTGMTILSNILARIVSAAVNFSLNRNFVFGSSVHILKSAIKYFLLALVVLVFNTCILRLLIAAGQPYMLAKIITETVMFFFSWTVQKLFIFKEAKT